MNRSTLILAAALPLAASAPPHGAAQGPAVEEAILGGGCFWCLEAFYQTQPGVLEVTNGYSGGSRENPSYEELCTGLTGHAEVLRIRFDPAKISYEKILELFWKIHDPTTENRQGADIGEQYRSVIFYKDERQKKLAEAAIRKAASLFENPIVTELERAGKFWEAEAYHQNYFRRNPDAGYCRAVIAPKLKKAESR